jgi:DnaJ-class molecular chaperone
LSRKRGRGLYITISENQGGRIEMDKDFVLEKYGMVICPLCGGKGFLIKFSERVNVTLRKVCIKCGGFGAVKKEAEVFKSLGN